MCDKRVTFDRHIALVRVKLLELRTLDYRSISGVLSYTPTVYLRTLDYRRFSGVFSYIPTVYLHSNNGISACLLATKFRMNGKGEKNKNLQTINCTLDTVSCKA